MSNYNQEDKKSHVTKNTILVKNESHFNKGLKLNILLEEMKVMDVQNKPSFTPNLISETLKEIGKAINESYSKGCNHINTFGKGPISFGKGFTKCR